MIVAEGLVWCAQQDRQGRFPLCSAPWYALALRLAADRTERAAARRAAREAVEVRRQAAPVVSALERLAGQGPPASFPPIAGTLLLAAAERSQLEAGPDRERWQAATAAWERLGRPFDAAYARFRQAEVLLAAGRGEAAAIAHRLGLDKQ